MLARAVPSLMLSAAALLAAPADAQTVIHDLSGSIFDSYGGTTDALDDVDQDGVPDFVVSPIIAGDIEIRSGKTGAMILSIPVSKQVTDVRRAGDVDGDGVEDIVVGYGTFASQYEVAVHSGKDGAKLLSAPGISGHRVRGAGDVDADGVLDVLAASPQIPPFIQTDPIRTFVISGATGQSLHSFASLPQDGGGSLVGAAGDVDVDGFDDFLLGNTPFPVLGVPQSVDTVSGQTGAVVLTAPATLGWTMVHLETSGDRDGDGTADYLRVFTAPGAVDSKQAHFEFVNGKTGAVSFTADGATEFSENAHGAFLGDVDGDGVGDMALGLGDLNSTGPGRIEVYSGVDGDLLFTLSGDQVGDSFGWSVSTAGDLDGDGRSEIIGAAPGMNGNGSYVRVFASCVRTSAAADGCPGSGGFAPRLRTSGCLEVGTPESLRVKDALGGSVAWFLVGTEPANVDLGAGCTLGVGLGAAVLNGPFAVTPGLPGTGETEWIETVPANASGFTYECQAFVLDRGARLGFSATGVVPVIVP